MTTPIRLISSMATKALLAELALMFEAQSPQYRLEIESVGGVDAAQRVMTGEAFDGVILASNAIDNLLTKHHLLAGSRQDLVHSGVAAAVPVGTHAPDITTVEALKKAVLDTPSLGYSTGPSGVELIKLFERWGLHAQIAHKLVQAKAGVPVGALLASGEVQLGFQQMSEMLGVQGIQVLGPLPDTVQITTTFSGGVSVTSQYPQAVQSLLTFWASPITAAAKQRHGMTQI
jgi:molybdate transport system substrate-binding protein